MAITEERRACSVVSQAELRSLEIDISATVGWLPPSLPPSPVSAERRVPAITHHLPLLTWSARHIYKLEIKYIAMTVRLPTQTRTIYDISDDLMVVWTYLYLTSHAGSGTFYYDERSSFYTTLHHACCKLVETCSL